MSQNHSNRRRRGRGGRKPRSSGSHQGVTHQSALGRYEQGEDAATFWSRSNARLGIDPDAAEAQGRKPKGPIEFACAVCGVSVMLERWPKERQAVRCDSCKVAMGGIFSEEDAEIATELEKKRAADKKGQFEGLPELTDEDKEAITEMRSRMDLLGNGRSGNNRRRSGGSNRKRRRSTSRGQGSKRGGNQNQSGNASGGSSRRRRRRRGGGGGGRPSGGGGESK